MITVTSSSTQVAMSCSERTPPSRLLAVTQILVKNTNRNTNENENTTENTNENTNTNTNENTNANENTNKNTKTNTNANTNANIDRPFLLLPLKSLLLAFQSTL